MRTYLLDVNVLIALLDPAHINHDAAHGWFSETGQHSWATCPITENAVVRILSNPAYPSVEWLPHDVILHLRKFLSQAQGHNFWKDEVSLLDSDLFNSKIIIGHKQLTDVYLLGLAVSHNATIATFDRSISLATVHNAINSNICLLG